MLLPKCVEAMGSIFIVANCPEGYPHLAAFLDSDENFMLYRRFGFLQARILLNKQDELRELEVKLDYMDSMSTPEVLQSRGIDVYKSDNRKNLLVTIEKKFKEYGIQSFHCFHIILLNR